MTNEATRDVLACDIDVRPVDAPGIDALAAAILGVERTGDSLVVSFASAAADIVERFAAAEQQCCATIRWDVENAPDAVRLRIGAAAEQLDLLEGLFTS